MPDSESQEKIKNLAVIGASLIGVQKTPGQISTRHLENDTWMLGYCFGFVDAISQSAQLDQYTYGMLLMTVIFDDLFDGDGLLEVGATLLNKALNLQGDEDFDFGLVRGGADFMNWRLDREKPPMGLFKFYNAKIG